MNFLKRGWIFFKIYPIDLIGVIFKVGKKAGFFRKKTSKGVDNPIRVCHSLASSLNVFEKRFSPL